MTLRLGVGVGFGHRLGAGVVNAAPVLSVGGGSLGGGTFTRASGATRVDQRGYIEEVGANVARWEYDPALTYNLAPNPWADGGDNPPTLPSGFGVQTFAGITPQYLGRGVRNGIPYTSWRVFSNGPAPNTQWGHVALNHPLVGALPAASGDVFTAMCWVEVTRIGPATSSGLPTLKLATRGYNAAGNTITDNYLNSTLPITQTFADGPVFRTQAMNNPLTAWFQAQLVIANSLVGLTHDYDFDIGFPIINRGSTPLTDTVPLEKLIERRNGVAVYGLRGLLLEGARTNQIADARTPGTTGWTPLGINTSTTTGIDNVAGSAILWTENGGTSRREALTTVAVTSGLTYVAQFFVRPVSNVQFVQVSSSVALPSTTRVNFDLTNVTVPTDDYGGSTIQAFGNGWYVLTVPMTAVSTGSGTVRLSIVDSGNAARLKTTTDAGRSIAVAAAQLEQASFGSTLILPPVGSPGASIRATDALTVPWSSIAPSGKATILITARLTSAGIGFQTLFGAHQNSNNNRFTVRLNAGNLALFRDLGGNGLGTNNTLSGLSGATALRCGLAVSGEKMTLFAAGGSLHSIATATPVVTLFQVGARNNNLDPMFGTVPVVRVLPRAVSDATLQALVNALPVPA